MRPIKIGVIGCGTISNIYFENMVNRYKVIEVAACADMFVGKAKDVAEKFNISKACSVKELLADPEIEIVVNLTIPAAHTEINLAVLEARKHVYCEKPLALNMEDAKKTIELAAKKNLLVGCAPDTFLGAGLQACRKIIDDGLIGRPVSATANFTFPGPEIWHPAPEFYYKSGAGPMMDMGPYYLTALVTLLGPIKRLNCFAKKTFDERVVLSNPLKGKKTDVEVFTNYCGLMEFQSGVIANINMSFDVWLSNLPSLEIYGTEGTLIVSDPNMFGGTVKILRGEDMLKSVAELSAKEAVAKIHSSEMYDFFKEVPLPYQPGRTNLRGLGVLDMAMALNENRGPRVSGELAYHVTEALANFDISASGGGTYEMASTCERPEPFDTGTVINLL